MNAPSNARTGRPAAAARALALLVVLARSTSLSHAATPTAAADPDAARETFRAYAGAMAAGDAANVSSLVVGDAKRMPLVTGRPAAADAERAFRAAVDAAFPGRAPPPATRPASQPASATVVRIDGEVATLTDRETVDPIKLRRIDGRWKIDLDATYPPEVAADLLQFRAALVDVMKALTADVTARRFASYEALQAELETRVKMRLATPDDSPSTRPAF